MSTQRGGCDPSCLMYIPPSPPVLVAHPPVQWLPAISPSWCLYGFGNSIQIEKLASRTRTMVRPFRQFSALLWPLLTSAPASRAVASAIPSSWDSGRSPRVSRVVFIPTPPNLPPFLPHRFWASLSLASSTRNDSLLSGSCSSVRDFLYAFLPTSPRDDAVGFK